MLGGARICSPQAKKAASMELLAKPKGNASTGSYGCYFQKLTLRLSGEKVPTRKDSESLKNRHLESYLTPFFLKRLRQQLVKIQVYPWGEQLNRITQGGGVGGDKRLGRLNWFVWVLR